jgi:2-polyprenyl-6-methoxyphenol hydroxylase-like FAD-dependent oxidoreductase
VANLTDGFRPYTSYCNPSPNRYHRGKQARFLGYEHEMIEQGFAAVQRVARRDGRLHARSAVSRFMSKLVFRTVDMLKRLQKLFGASDEWT